MLIADSKLQLSASYHFRERHEARETLTTWVGEGGSRRTTTATHQSINGQAIRTIQSEPSPLSVSPRATQLQPQKAIIEMTDSMSPGDKGVAVEFSLMRSLVEAFSGFKIKIVTIADVQAQVERPNQIPNPTGVKSRDSEEQGERVGWGLVYDAYESHQEVERSSFSAKGSIHTADGQEVIVDLELTMSREFSSETRLNLRAGDALKDPLVINYSGNAAELTETQYSFDIDVDGKVDQIAFVRPGSGFLVLDKSGDGKINDGSELFGAVSGDGFSELAAYDDDSNGWIDEGDAIYDRLRIWSKDASGNDQLVALGKRGVGALYLGHIETPFLLKDIENHTIGAVRESSVYLSDEGEVGTVQQIDLVV